MKTDKNLPDLAQGQLWKADGSYIQIVERGKRLIHYKMMKQPAQKAVMTRMVGIEALVTYLRKNGATLISQPAVVTA